MLEGSPSEGASAAFASGDGELFWSEDSFPVPFSCGFGYFCGKIPGEDTDDVGDTLTKEEDDDSVFSFS
jgi:hypothetical protein